MLKGTKASERPTTPLNLKYFALLESPIFFSFCTRLLDVSFCSLFPPASPPPALPLLASPAHQIRASRTASCTEASCKERASSLPAEPSKRFRRKNGGFLFLSDRNAVKAHEDVFRCVTFPPFWCKLGAKARFRSSREKTDRRSGSTRGWRESWNSRGFSFFSSVGVVDLCFILTSFSCALSPPPLPRPLHSGQHPLRHVRGDARRPLRRGGARQDVTVSLAGSPLYAIGGLYSCPSAGDRRKALSIVGRQRALARSPTPTRAVP